jgi:hydrogenase expression/formation protein HypC
MCIGIPMQVTEPLGTSAWCAGRDGRRLIDMSLVGPQPAGAWVLTFLDAAREVLTPERAALIDDALDGLQAALAGDTARVDELFADLTGREPMLPEHLRAKEQ